MQQLAWPLRLDFQLLSLKHNSLGLGTDGSSFAPSFAPRLLAGCGFPIQPQKISTTTRPRQVERARENT
jgi:hypothetical protein